MIVLIAWCYIYSRNTIISFEYVYLLPKIYLILYPYLENLTIQIAITDGCISLSLSSFVCCTFCLPSPASKFTARFLRSESWQILSCAIWAMLGIWAHFGSTPSARRRKLCWIRFYADIRLNINSFLGFML